MSKTCPKPLLDEEQTSSLIGSTVGNFANRLKRKIKEQEVLEDESQRARKYRHQIMLQAMNTTRRALQETCKISLGSRFYFELEIGDWEGWPRLELNLIDKLAPEKIELGLIVNANDRKDLGTIQISTRALEILGKVHLNQAGELERLPLILKRALRQFLDSLSGHLLKPASAQKLQDSKPIEVPEPECDVIQRKLNEEEGFFVDEVNDNDNLVAHQSGALEL